MSAAAAAFFDSGRHGAGSLIRALSAKIEIYAALVKTIVFQRFLVARISVQK
jgi:hypothetical protein